jgi:hypothetical protein
MHYAAKVKCVFAYPAHEGRSTTSTSKTVLIRSGCWIVIKVCTCKKVFDIVASCTSDNNYLVVEIVDLKGIDPLIWWTKVNSLLI